MFNSSVILLTLTQAITLQNDAFTVV